MAELQLQFKQQPIIIVCGVSGSGKSSVGQALAKHLSLTYLEADDFHPSKNVDKMSQGIPLNDEDRWPWLRALSRNIRETSKRHRGVIASCSALKRIYRGYIQEQIKQPILFVFLDGDRETLYERMQARCDHYMPPYLLNSQLADLERPDANEPAITLPISLSLDDLVDEIVKVLSLSTKD